MCMYGMYGWRNTVLKMHGCVTESIPCYDTSCPIIFSCKTCFSLFTPCFLHSTICFFNLNLDTQCLSIKHFLLAAFVYYDSKIFIPHNKTTINVNYNLGKRFNYFIMPHLTIKREYATFNNWGRITWSRHFPTKSCEIIIL